MNLPTYSIIYHYVIATEYFILFHDYLRGNSCFRCMMIIIQRPYKAEAHGRVQDHVEASTGTYYRKKNIPNKTN